MFLIQKHYNYSRNSSYAPYLPADDDGTGSYVRMLEKKYSLEPLKRALDLSEKNLMSYEELPSGIVRKVSVSYFVFSIFILFFCFNKFIVNNCRKWLYLVMMKMRYQ